MPSNGVSTSTQRAPDGPCAISSSSLWRMRPTSSWPSSAPQRTSSGMPRAASARAQLDHAGVDLDRVGEPEVGAHVRGDHDRARALGDGRAGELEAGLHVGGTVVDAGEQVEVKVGVCHHRCSIGDAPRHPVTVR